MKNACHDFKIARTRLKDVGVLQCQVTVSWDLEQTHFREAVQKNHTIDMKLNELPKYTVNN